MWRGRRTVDRPPRRSRRVLVLTRPIREELRRRLQALSDAGLGYLAPAREIATLSGGEAQRVRLAAALGGGLVGATYVLDEPTQGLHPRDTARLVGVLKGLAAAGNAVVVVEHDAELVAAADHMLELGPGSGPEGGLLVASGPPSALRDRPATYTSRLLRGNAEAATRTFPKGSYIIPEDICWQANKDPKKPGRSATTARTMTPTAQSTNPTQPPTLTPVLILQAATQTRATRAYSSQQVWSTTYWHPAFRSTG